MERKKQILIIVLFASFLIIYFFLDNIKIGCVKAFKLSYEIKSLDSQMRLNGRYLKIEKGIIISEGNYKHGSAEGTFRFYYPSGKIKEKMFFKNNKIFGAKYGYLENGILNYKIYNLNGLYGDSFHYNENGQMDIYGANDIENSFFYYSNYSGLSPMNVIGTIFSENIYSYDVREKKIVRLSDKVQIHNISDLYITIANPPQLTREVEIEVNKMKWSTKNLKSSTILLQKIFARKGKYDISINAKLIDINGTIFKADSLRITIMRI